MVTMEAGMEVMVVTVVREAGGGGERRMYVESVVVQVVSFTITYICNIHVTFTDVGQIPLPSNAIIPRGPFTSEDLERAIDSHYNFIVANVKVNTLSFINSLL